MVDNQAFEQAWREHGATILRYCRFAAGSSETGEDIAAETFARFLQRGSHVPAEKVEAWLFTVARNLVRDHQNRAARWRRLLPRLGQPGNATSNQDSSAELADMLSPLNPDQRLAVYLRVIEGRSFSEVARLTGKTEDATKKAVYRALERLRDLEQSGGEVVAHSGGVGRD